MAAGSCDTKRTISAPLTQGLPLAQRRFHYDLAFEHYLRANAIPYVAVDEAKRALSGAGGDPSQASRKLKSFDFVVYSQNGPNLLVDVKGRKHASSTGRSLQNWVTHDDVDSLEQWAKLFGHGFEAAFAFLFWCEAEPPDALFLEMFEFQGRWYAVLGIRLADYQPHMRDRSAKWDTVNVPSKVFSEHARPLKSMLQGHAAL